MPFVHLFREGRGAVTLLLWVVNFMNLLILYSLSNWLPTVVTGMGYSQNAARARRHDAAGRRHDRHLRPRLADRARAASCPMLAVTFAVATVSIALIGQPGLSLTLLSVIVFVAGWCIVGGQPGLNALAATLLPDLPARSTGVGAGLGVGRIGAIVGPYVGGVLLAQQWTAQQLFWAAAVPAGISTIVLFALLKVLGADMGRRSGGGERTAMAEPAPLAH